MSVIGSNVLAGASGGGAAAYEIERSLRFNAADSAYLSRTPSSAGNRRTWTWSGWVKRSKPSGGYYQTIFSSTASNYGLFYFNGSDSLELYNESSGSALLVSTQVFRDFSAWYHFVFRFDTTESTAANRLRVYVNGAEITSWSTDNRATLLTLNLEGIINSAIKHEIGGETTYNRYLGGYLADVHFIDGQALAASDFGEFDDNNVWQPKEFTGSYGWFDQSQTWSGLWSGTAGYGSFAYLHNANVDSDYVQTLNGTMTLSSALTITSLRIKLNRYGANVTLSVNGTDVTSQLPAGGSGLQWVTITGFTSLSSIAVTGNDYSSNLIGLYAIEVNGKLLIDSGITGIADNSFHLDFSDNSSTTTLAEDSSGQSNDWTVNNLSVASGSGNDSLIDTPTNYTAASGNNGGNYATLNPLKIFGGASMSNGNLDGTTATANQGLYGTIAMSSGKWYWEITNNSAGGMHGIANLAYANNNWNSGTGGYFYYYANGNSYQSGNIAASYGDSYTTNDVIGVAYDADNGNLYFYKNGTIQNSGTAAFTGLSGTFAPFFMDGSGGTHTFTVNFGQRPFSISSIPTGYKALCTTNLPDPTIADGSTAMDVTLWTGNGSARSITFNNSPDFAWMKARSLGSANHGLFDTVRGATKRLVSNSTGAESTQSQTLTAFNSDGFDLGTDSAYNGNTYPVVGWAWSAGENSNKTYTVKVVSDSGNKYRFDDFGTSAVTLDLEEGSTYVFDQSDSSNSGHPLRFSTTSDGTHGSGTEYTTGVTATGTPGSAGAKTTIVVASSAPTLYYYCTAHSGMGGQANTNSTAGASNFDGTIQATVKASQTAGFSIVSWTGSTQSTAYVGHGLGKQPDFIVAKTYDGTGNWYVFEPSLDTGGTISKALYLNSSAGKATVSGVWGHWDEMTSTTFGITDSAGSGTNDGDMIAYCFTSVDQFSSFGTYTGNGNADGPHVTLSFRPAFLLLKRTDNTGNWLIYDNKREGYNFNNDPLYANLTSAEGTTDYIDLLSNGFKIRNTHSSINASSSVYLYAAFALHPLSANGGLAR